MADDELEVVAPKKQEASVMGMAQALRRFTKRQAENKFQPLKHIPGLHRLPPLEQFYQFHERNPHVYQYLHALAHKMKLLGYTSGSIRFMVEKLRWDATEQSGGADGQDYAVPSSCPAYYARALMQADATLAGFFRVIKTHRSKHVEQIDLVRMGLAQAIEA
jgi:hypothetical protein